MENIRFTNDAASTSGVARGVFKRTADFLGAVQTSASRDCMWVSIRQIGQYYDQFELRAHKF